MLVFPRLLLVFDRLERETSSSDDQIRAVYLRLDENVKIDRIRFLLDDRICKHLKNNIAFLSCCLYRIDIHLCDGFLR